jgi:hypothetical protein
MNGWIVQVYGYVPAVAGAVNVTVCPGLTSPVSNVLAVAAVTVCATESLLITATFWPAETLKVDGLKAKLLMTICGAPTGTPVLLLPVLGLVLGLVLVLMLGLMPGLLVLVLVGAEAG